MKPQPPNDCYIGTKPCGCVVAWVSGRDNDSSASVMEMVENGLTVKPAVTSEVVGKLRECECVQSTEVATLARRIIKRLVADINDRSGIKHAWRAIDEDVMKDELLPEWERLIVEELNSGRCGGKEESKP